MDHSQSTSVAEPGRHLDPHVRQKHVRLVGGKEFPVRASIVNIETARRQLRLSALTRVLQLSHGISPRGRRITTQNELDSPQMDLVVELQRAMRIRGEQILDEGVSKYARLTMNERGHLAMARVRVGIAESADRQNLNPRTAYMREDLARLESLLFVGSLARLEPEEVIAVREASRHRLLKRMDAEAAAARPSCGPRTASQSEPAHEAHVPERPRG